MTTEHQSVPALKGQLQKWSVQMDLLTMKREAALLEARQYEMELDELRSNYKALAQQIHTQERSDNHCYMWENIGEGG
jgi:hypothetical protein